MRKLVELWRRVLFLLRRGRFDREMSEEMRFHLEMKIEENIEDGMTPEEALSAARRQFGNQTLLRETSREVWSFGMIETLFRDVRYAARVLLKSPGFTLVAVVTLSLGVGGNTAIFGVVNSVFFRALPFREAERLVRLRDYTVAPDGQRNRFNINDRHFIEIGRESRAFEGVTALNGDSFTLVGGNVPQRLSGVNVSPGWLDTLGVRPAIGRGFGPEEERLGRASGVALISHALWQQQFGGAQNILGQKLTLDTGACTIVGVMPAGFRFPYEADVWLPAQTDPNSRRDSAVFARLRPGATLEQAQQEMKAVAARVREMDPETSRDYGIEVTPARESLIEGEEKIAVALLSVVGFLLLLACINVANLLLARSVARGREMAIRAALGASRWRQIRQMLTESVLLSLLGCAGGLLLTIWLGDYLATLMPTNLTRQLNLSRVTVDWRVLGFALAASLVTGIVCGIAPALRGADINLQSFLKDGGRASGGRNRRLLNLFVVGEIALALVLLSGAGLMVQNFQHLRNRDLGFDKERLLTMIVSLPEGRYDEPARRLSAIRQIVGEVSSLPGVASAGVTTINPLRGWQSSAPVVVEGKEQAVPDGSFSVNHRLVTPGLFKALGVRLVRGRDFTEQDHAGGPGVAVVSESAARRFWPGEDPLGKRVRVNRPNSSWLTVVGVVGDVKDAGDLRETWYLPYYQHAESPAARDVHLMTRGTGDPEALALAVRQAVARADKNLAAYEVSTMDRVFDETLSQDRIGTVVATAFAAFGLLLATLGIYGVLSYVVRQRTNEIGIRLALGATGRDVLRLIIGRGIVLALAGVASGVAAALVVNRVFASVMTEVTTASPLIYFGVSAILLLISLAACYVPARRATKVDPMEALRYE